MQNGLAEHAICTTMEDVCTLLRDAGLGHSFWVEAAAFSVDTHNLVLLCRHPGRIPLKSFSGKRQDVAHLRVFGSKCWTKIPMVHGIQIMGGSKLDNCGVECFLLGYVGGGGNYKVQDVMSRKVFISHDIIFEEGHPHCTSPSVGEVIQLFDMLNMSPVGDNVDYNKSMLDTHSVSNNSDDYNPTMSGSGLPPVPLPLPAEDLATDIPLSTKDATGDKDLHPVPAPPALRRSTQVPLPSNTPIQSGEYQQREIAGQREERDWATNCPCAVLAANDHNVTIKLTDYTACLAKTKASHHIPHSYRHAISSDPEQWLPPMRVEMDTLKKKHTWDLVKAPEGVNMMVQNGSTISNGTARETG